jgi:signal transduction histidine kinase
MKKEESILNVIIDIVKISNETGIDFHEKMQRILLAIVNSINTAKGSIMIVKRKKLEVISATSPEIIGYKQSVDSDSPSAWVVKNKKPLYRNISDGAKKDRYIKDAFYIIPIFNGGKVIGVLNLTEKIGSDAFTQEEQALLLEISGYFISAIETHRLAEELKEKRKTLKKKNTKLKQLESLRSELFHMLIHDLKGPASEVVANLDILTYTATSENMEYVTAAQSGCDTLVRMISDLLDIARLEEGSLELIRETLHADELIQEAISRLPALARLKNLSIIKKFDISTKRPFFGDRSLLLRVLQNLIVNAIDYSPKGENIEVGYRYSDSKSLTFFVIDNGPGIAPEFQHTIFDKYVQAKNKSEGIFFSTGLGLTFCKLAVEAHNGEIFVESDGRHGTCFMFTVKTIQEPSQAFSPGNI